MGHRDDGKPFVARADEKLTAFLELESAIRPRKQTKFNSHSLNTRFAVIEVTFTVCPPKLSSFLKFQNSLKDFASE
jgi:hypothetical protein